MNNSLANSLANYYNVPKTFNFPILFFYFSFFSCYFAHCLLSVSIHEQNKATYVHRANHKLESHGLQVPGLNSSREYDFPSVHHVNTLEPIHWKKAVPIKM